MAGEPAVLGGGRDQGYLDQYRYHVYRGPDGGGAVIALDCYGELAAISNLTAISGAVMGGCVLITLAIIVPVSKRALRPYVRNLERQRRFVTDASHELKTPWRSSPPTPTCPRRSRARTSGRAAPISRRRASPSSSAT